MRKRIVFVLTLLMFSAIPASAVFNEKNLNTTLDVLRLELEQEVAKARKVQEYTSLMSRQQRQQMVSMIKRCNELSLMLYSQNQDFTFDMTYAFDEVTKEYDRFNRERMPYDRFVERLEMEIDKYERLLESLRRIPPMLEEIEEVPDSLKAATDSLLLGSRPHNGAGSPALREFRRQKLDGNRARQPFVLDSLGCVTRDSCVSYALSLLNMCTAQRDEFVRDAEHYESTNNRLKESFDYAQTRYRTIQNSIFKDGQTNYFSVLRFFGSYLKETVDQAKSKYGTGDGAGSGSLGQSEWRGPVVAGFIVFVFLHLLLATLLSMGIFALFMKKRSSSFGKWLADRRRSVILFLGVLIFAVSFSAVGVLADSNFLKMATRLLLIYSWIMGSIVFSMVVRLEGESLRQSQKAYMPLMVLGLTVIAFRIIFVPNTTLNLVLPPALLACSIWQSILCRRCGKEMRRSDYLCNCLTLLIFIAATVISWAGYVFMGVQLLIWWLFQLAAIQTVIAVHSLLELYWDKVERKRMDRYAKSHIVIDKGSRDSYIEVTWFFNFVKDALLPVIATVSVPLCIYLAADVFNLSGAFDDLLHKPFLNLTNASESVILSLSVHKIVLVFALFFVFRYVNSTVKAFYKLARYRKLMSAGGRKYVHTNEVNLTLANNIITILVWGAYIIMAVLMLRIPMGAISIVAAGLATGLGLAMKDVLNNFIYGIQLMSGRARVGDYIECDGIRGKVESISYQSTQILTADQAIMSFTNTSLFNKNFKNLTKNNAYEFVKIIVGVAYGTDVETVRQLILGSLEGLVREDKYGRSTIDRKKGFAVTFDGFGDSSVNLAVKAYVLVEERYAFVAAANEIIYRVLGENSIEIPFPQRDVHIR